jgi:hypothetical protein
MRSVSILLIVILWLGGGRVRVRVSMKGRVTMKDRRVMD